MPHVVLVAPATSYRIPSFLEAARRLRLEVTVASDGVSALADATGGRMLRVDFSPVGEGVARILTHARERRIDAVIGTDDATGVLAAAASKALRLPHNDPQSVALSTDKHRFRQTLAGAGIRGPWFELIAFSRDLERTVDRLRYPCVLKPLHLCASRGVIRADDPAACVIAAKRIGHILEGCGPLASRRQRETILAEGFITGREIAIDGLLDAGRFTPLSLFDKPDPLDGPFFEETLYLTPSTLSPAEQLDVFEQVTAAARALGLLQGPIHAELRINDEGATLIELAPRSIGGLCSSALRFVPDLSLEELILRHAVGLPVDNYTLDSRATGVMMIPIPCGGRLAAVNGLPGARAIPHVDDVVISIPVGDVVVPLPEGDCYLGFIFASGENRDAVEAALRRAHRVLAFDIQEKL